MSKKISRKTEKVIGRTANGIITEEILYPTIDITPYVGNSGVTYKSKKAKKKRNK